MAYKFILIIIQNLNCCKTIVPTLSVYNVAAKIYENFEKINIIK